VPYRNVGASPSDFAMPLPSLRLYVPLGLRAQGLGLSVLGFRALGLG